MAYSFGALTNPLTLSANFEQIGAAPAGGFKTTNYVGTNRYGNFIPATNQQRNKVSDMVLTFRAILPAGATVNFVLGGTGTDNWVITRVNCKQVNTTDAIIQVTIHKHDNLPAGHLAQSFLVALPSSGYGITANPLTGGELVENCIGMDWTAEIGHKDKENRLGDHLTGFSNACRINCVQTYVDDEAEIAAAANWFIDSDEPSDDADDTRSRVVTGHTFVDPQA